MTLKLLTSCNGWDSNPWLFDRVSSSLTTRPDFRPCKCYFLPDFQFRVRCETPSASWWACPSGARGPLSTPRTPRRSSCSRRTRCRRASCTRYLSQFWHPGNYMCFIQSYYFSIKIEYEKDNKHNLNLFVVKLMLYFFSVSQIYQNSIFCKVILEPLF